MACAKVVISDFELLTVDDAGRRRAWTDEDKVRIVEESLRGHRQGSATARRRGVSRSLLTRWRAEYRAGPLVLGRATFTPLSLAPDTSPAPLVSDRGQSAPEATIEVVLANGRRIVVPTSVDIAALARLLPVLDGA